MAKLTMSRYAFPPLLKDIIMKDINMSQTELANSNIIALLATLLVRLIAGPCCDRWGARKTFAGTLLIGALPTFLAGAVTTPQGLYALRFFIGVLGGSFVPCQVWTTAFYDKNVVGTANAMTGGWGNTGGGITYFIMPHVYTSLVGDGLTPHVAWRVSFVVPGIVIVATALAMLLLAPDTPTGRWADRQQPTTIKGEKPSSSSSAAAGQGLVDVPGHITDKTDEADGMHSPPSPGKESPTSPADHPGNGNGSVASEKLDKLSHGPDSPALSDSEAEAGATTPTGTGEEEARYEIIQSPTFKEILAVTFAPQTLVLGACYFNSFGAELVFDSILGNYYSANFRSLGVTGSGDYAAMFGLLNFAFRPLGGLVGDFAYRRTGSLWSKKILMHAYGVMTGMCLIIIGKLDPKNQSEMFGLVALMAFFLEGGNGLNFGLVPHVCPYANGVVSGFTGGMGNLGGIVFAIIFRYNGTDYAKCFWILGIIAIGMNVAVCWIRPIPKGQLGGH
jgi:NNP family nitrate/nitrite transporter-like MFS transporter